MEFMVSQADGRRTLTISSEHKEEIRIFIDNIKDDSREEIVLNIGQAYYLSKMLMELAFKGKIE